MWIFQIMLTTTFDPTEIQNWRTDKAVTLKTTEKIFYILPGTQQSCFLLIRSSRSDNLSNIWLQSFFFCQQQRQLRDKPERWAHKISLLSSSHCLEYTWFQRDSMISEDVLKTPTFKHMNRRWHFLQFHRTWVYTQALWFVARISTFIGLMLRSYFYQFSLINWPIAILIQNDIHALDEIRITIDTDDARAKVIYQIFQA